MSARTHAAIATLGALATTTMLLPAPAADAIEGGTPSSETKGTVAILRDVNTSQGYVRCTGTLITETKVLTTPSCTEGDPTTMRVRVGSLSWDTGGILHRVVHAHRDVWGGEFGILTLEKPAFNADTVDLAATLPEAREAHQIRGWGVGLTSSDPASRKLRQAPVTADYPENAFGEPDTDTLTSEIAAGSHVRLGDIGGPQFNEDGEQVGIIARARRDTVTSTNLTVPNRRTSITELMDDAIPEPSADPGPAATQTRGAVAILSDEDTQHGRLRCSGALLSETKVITSHHCVPSAATDLTVRAGSLMWNSGGSLHEVVRHTTRNGLAILTLASPATDADTVRLTPHEPGQSHTLDMVGWGDEAAGGHDVTSAPLSEASGWNHGVPGAELRGVRPVEGQATLDDIGGPMLNSIGQLVGVVGSVHLNSGYSFYPTAPEFDWIRSEAGLW